MHNSLDGRGTLGRLYSFEYRQPPTYYIENQSKEKSDHLFLRPDGTPYKTKK
jgi:hypothetical protein